MWVHSVKPYRILHRDAAAGLSDTLETIHSTALIKERQGEAKSHRFRLKKRLASTALRTLRSCGAFTAAGKSLRRANSLLILCYHGIALHDEHKCWPHLYITPQVFRQRLLCLRAVGATVLPLDEALQRLQRGSLPPLSVAITFDDGFYDFLEHGIPILSDCGFPSTLYLTTHYCDYRLPIIGLTLDYILWKSGRQSIRVPELGSDALLPSRTYAERQAIVKGLLQWTERQGMKTLGKNEFARQLAERLGVDYQAILDRRLFQILSPNEVGKVVRAGVDVQLHTHRHRTPKTQDLFLREIEDNRRRIIELTGKIPSHFCYPSGEYSPEFFRWLGDCGVQSATTCEAGLVSRSSPSMKLPRILDDSGMNMLRFESLISGLFV